jgi:hypothetical protein
MVLATFIGRDGMKLVAAGLTLLMLGGCVVPGMAATPNGLGSNPAEAAKLSADMKQAQASAAAQASRPGDEAMDCAAIQAELMAQMQDPNFKAGMASLGAGAQDQKARQDAAMASGKAKAGDAESSAAFTRSAGANLTTMMPQIMRGQRLNELATAKKCAFLNQKPG